MSVLIIHGFWKKCRVSSNVLTFCQKREDVHGKSCKQWDEKHRASDGTEKVTTRTLLTLRKTIQ